MTGTGASWRYHNHGVADGSTADQELDSCGRVNAYEGLYDQIG